MGPTLRRISCAVTLTECAKGKRRQLPCDVTYMGLMVPTAKL
jgi:hypothetical protein